MTVRLAALSRSSAWARSTFCAIWVLSFSSETCRKTRPSSRPARTDDAEPRPRKTPRTRARLSPSARADGLGMWTSIGRGSATPPAAARGACGRAGPETRRGIARRDGLRTARSRDPRGGGRGGRRGRHAGTPSLGSLRATRMRAERGAGVLGDLTRGRGDAAARSAARPAARAPQRQTGSPGGQMQPCARSARKRFTRRSSRDWKEIPANRPFSAESVPRQRQRVVDLPQLVVDGDPDRLEGPLGRVPAGEARAARGSRR